MQIVAERWFAENGGTGAMSEIGEEEIARAIALELAAFRKQMFPDSSVDILPSEHARATGIMIVVVKPALDRARREERERCAKVAEQYADAYHIEEAQYRSVAAAIRKG